MTESTARDLHLVKKALAIAALAIERQFGPFQSASDQPPARNFNRRRRQRFRQLDFGSASWAGEGWFGHGSCLGIAKARRAVKRPSRTRRQPCARTCNGSATPGTATPFMGTSPPCMTSLLGGRPRAGKSIEPAGLCICSGWRSPIGKMPLPPSFGAPPTRPRPTSELEASGHG
jgi:hypothetical protein